MLFLFINFQSNTRVLPSSRRGAEIAAPLSPHCSAWFSSLLTLAFIMVTSVIFQKPIVAVHSPASRVGNGFFSNATMETLSLECQNFSVGRAASHSLVSVTHACVSSAG